MVFGSLTNVDRRKLVKRRITYLGVAWKLWKDSKSKAPDMAFGRRLRYLLKGHNPLEGAWYDQVHGSLDGCVSKFDRETTLSLLNGDHSYLLSSKLVFGFLLKGAGFPHPEIYGYTSQGRWHFPDGGEGRLREVLASGKRAVVKPITGSLGSHIEFIRAFAELDKKYPEDMLVSSYVEQAGYSAMIYPGSLNTIRILTVVRENGPPRVLAASHRFGGSESGGVDNFSAGGMAARIDLDSGIMDRAVRVGRNNEVVWSDVHPDTRATIKGAQVEHWEAVKAQVVELCRTFPFLRYVGWDIAVTEAGPVIIEGNNRPGPVLFQMYQPLLKDERTREFFADHAS
ncbi:MAG TPA: sugar-transfer associated ATP-grasp domain-containing protein [Sphingomicrobium sp.]|jgi:hypothetical protein|nr:sugar-transfer associated ATP-grasp domain-containing protein [Sphingomicrobium sp.]